MNWAEKQSDCDDNQGMKHINGKRVIGQYFDQPTLIVEFFPKDADQSDAHGNRHKGFP